MARNHLDEIDHRILALLQQQARISIVKLAERVGLTPAPCLRRLQALEHRGVIRKYVTLLNPVAVKLGVSAFVQVSLDRQAGDRLELFENTIRQRPEVLECYLIMGDADYLLRVVVSDVTAYERFLTDFLARLPGVVTVKSILTLKPVKYSTVLPLGDQSTVEIPAPTTAPRPRAVQVGPGRATGRRSVGG